MHRDRFQVEYPGDDVRAQPEIAQPQRDRVRHRQLAHRRRTVHPIHLDP
jgi:hypothetical protein